MIEFHNGLRVPTGEIVNLATKRKMTLVINHDENSLSIPSDQLYSCDRSRKQKSETGRLTVPIDEKHRSTGQMPIQNQFDLGTGVGEAFPVKVNLILSTDALDYLASRKPRLLSKQEASSYCSVSTETFDEYRRKGIVPDPVPGTSRWDIDLINKCLDKVSGIGQNTVPEPTTHLDEWRAQSSG